MKAKLYSEMTAKEQLQWVTEFSAWAENDMRVLTELKPGTWTRKHREMMEQGLRLMAAFAFAENYVATALHYGDYDRRAYNLPRYVELVKKEVGKGVAVTDGSGNKFAYVPQLKQMQRRRGRPTREEAAQYQQMMASAQDGDVETEKQQQIARMMGLEIVTNPVGREKNNDELRVEREVRQAEEDKMNPSLFAEAETAVSEASASEAPTVPIQSQARLHLDQLAWLMSDDLKERVGRVREMRAAAGAAAEKAKALAEHGAKPEEIEPLTKEAAKYTEQYEQVYEDVDTELATVCYRLKNDEPYRERFQKRFKIQDTEKIRKELNPYLRKMVMPEFETKMKALIEQESPEYAEKVKQEKERKIEQEAIIKYLRRRDKKNTRVRVITAKERFKRLQEIMGEEQAEAYRPLLTAIEEDYQKNIETKKKK